MEPGTSCENILGRVESPSRRSGSKGASKRKPKGRPSATNDAPTEDETLPAVGTMARTKRLILAALRVWELKRGIRD